MHTYIHKVCMYIYVLLFDVRSVVLVTTYHVYSYKVQLVYNYTTVHLFGEIVIMKCKQGREESV